MCEKDFEHQNLQLEYGIQNIDRIQGCYSNELDNADLYELIQCKTISIITTIEAKRKENVLHNSLALCITLSHCLVTIGYIKQLARFTKHFKPVCDCLHTTLGRSKPHNNFGQNRNLHRALYKRYQKLCKKVNSETLGMFHVFVY